MQIGKTVKLWVNYWNWSRSKVALSNLILYFFAKSKFTQYLFFVLFGHLWTFFLLHEKVCSFSSAFLYVHICTNQIVTYWTKFFLKIFFVKKVQSYFEISLSPFIHKIFEQNFCQYVTIYLVRLWAYKNAHEKVHSCFLLLFSFHPAWRTG